MQEMEQPDSLSEAETLTSRRFVKVGHFLGTEIRGMSIEISRKDVRAIYFIHRGDGLTYFEKTSKDGKIKEIIKTEFGNEISEGSHNWLDEGIIDTTSPGETAVIVWDDLKASPKTEESEIVREVDLAVEQFHPVHGLSSEQLQEFAQTAGITLNEKQTKLMKLENGTIDFMGKPTARVEGDEPRNIDLFGARYRLMTSYIEVVAPQIWNGPIFTLLRVSEDKAEALSLRVDEQDEATQQAINEATSDWFKWRDEHLPHYS